MPSRPFRSFVGAVGTLALSACIFSRGRHAAAPPAPLSMRDSIVALDASRGQIQSGRDWLDVAAGLLASDVIYLAPGAPIVVGRDAARTILGALRPPDAAIVTYEPLGAGLSRDGSAGYTFGSRVTTLPTAAPSERVRISRYIAYWRATREGWRIVAYADVGGDPVTADVAAAVTAPRPPLLRQRGEAAEAAARRVWSTDSLFAVLADREGAASAFGANVADYGVTFAGTLLMIGPQAVRAQLEARSGGSLTWSPVFADAAESGDLGFTVGEYVFTGTGASGAVTQRLGKYLSIWKLQSGGHWRFVVDGGNPSPARTE